MIPFGSIVSASTHTILAVAQSGEFDAYFEVECTNDHAHVERFNYDKKEIAIAVAQSFTMSVSMFERLYAASESL